MTGNGQPSTAAAGETETLAGRDPYPLRNADEREGQRLSLLEALSDPVSIRVFDRLGVGAGWRCAELGAGGGSMVAWLSDRVGPSGLVTAVDRDASRVRELAASRRNVTVVEGDLCVLDLPPGSFDLVHSRSVIMHLPCPDRVLEAAVSWLAPGGLAFFEETDGAPGQEATEVPEPFRVVFGPLAARWSWARGMADRLRALGMADVTDDVRHDPMVGGTPKAEFWKFTLGSVADLQRQTAARQQMQSEGIDTGALLDALPAMLALLDDPDFSAPFTARHRVTARRPG